MNEFSQQYLPSRPILNVRNTGKIRTTHVEKVLVIQLLNQHCRQQLLEFLGDSTHMFVPRECQIHVFYFFHCSMPSPQHICLFFNTPMVVHFFKRTETRHVGTARRKHRTMAYLHSKLDRTGTKCEIDNNSKKILNKCLILDINCSYVIRFAPDLRMT